MSDEWAPSTDDVRTMYLLGLEAARKAWGGPVTGSKEAVADFERWRARHELEIVARTRKEN
jgi:hypothetical protein